MKTPLWQKTWFIMLMFFIVTPVGIVLMWIGKKEWGKAIKIILSVIFGFYAFLWSLILLGSEVGENSTEPTEQTTAYWEETQERTTINFQTPTREETTAENTTVAEETTAKPATTKKETTTTKPTTTKKVTTTAKPTTTKKETTTAKPTTTQKETTTAKSTAQNSSNEYVLNTSTLKFHKPGCNDVDKMDDENKEYFKGNRQTVIDRGYSPCGHCHP